MLEGTALLVLGFSCVGAAGYPADYVRASLPPGHAAHVNPHVTGFRCAACPGGRLALTGWLALAGFSIFD